MVQDRINQANGRLKAAKIRVAIQQIGDRLYLQATLPPKPDTGKTKPYQQRIALGVAATPAGVSLAEKEARKVAVAIDGRTFSWEPYLPAQTLKPETVGDWVTKFEAEYRDTVAAITWRTEYYNVFKTLPANKPFSAEVLKEALMSTPPHTRTRRRFSTSLAKLAEFAGVEVNFKPFQGAYSATQVEPRHLPDDRTIAKWFNEITSPGWRWVYGMIATFGLRDHEVFYLDTEELEQGKSMMIAVKEGKTGKHLVWACYPEWVEQFDLRHKVLPPVTGKEHSDFTQRVSQWFGRNLPLHALDLRHRWAVRTLEFGLPYELAAKQMGHSVTVHERTYHRWITADTHQRAYDALMLRSDRPTPPVPHPMPELKPGVDQRTAQECE